METRISMLFLLIFISILLIVSTQGRRYFINVPRKCCAPGHLFNEKLQCVNRTVTLSYNNKYITEDIVVINIFKCKHNHTIVYNTTNSKVNGDFVTVRVPHDFCIEDLTNGTTVVAKCPDHKHASSMGTVIFWGARTYLGTNIGHVSLCIVVVLIYVSVSMVRRGLYNRLVIRHNICHMMNGVVLQLLGFCELANCHFDDNVIIFLWLCLQYFTIATVFWLNVICFDMTLVITQFKWIVGTSNRTDRIENRKIFLYGLFGWGASFLPVLMAGLFDFIPGVPDDFILKPNYLWYGRGPRPIINIYFFGVPMFTLLLNNILFIFTTVKIIRIKRSTQMATHNQTNLLKKKYFLFLRLYLLMGAPWFFGMFLACFNELVVLKSCRLIQPTIWLLMLITHQEVIKRVKNFCVKKRQPQNNIATISG